VDSVPVYVALIAAIPPTLAVLISFVALLLQGRQIHTLVNSNLASVKTELGIANLRIATLLEEIQALRGRLDDQV